jgi:aspartate carbamoyltransferase catalytic subunit
MQTALNNRRIHTSSTSGVAPANEPASILAEAPSERIVRVISPALAKANFDAYGCAVDCEGSSEEEMQAEGVLSSLKSFINNNYAKATHEERLSAFFRSFESDYHQIALATNLIVGCDNLEARDFLSGLLKEPFERWAQRISPQTIRDVRTVNGGWGRPVQNELALIADELRFLEQRNEYSECFFLPLLFNSAAVLPSQTVYSLRNHIWHSKVVNRSPREFYDSLEELYTQRTEGLRVAWRGWIAQPEAQPNVSHRDPWRHSLAAVASEPADLLDQLRSNLDVLRAIPRALIETDDLQDSAIPFVFKLAKAIEAKRLEDIRAGIKGPRAIFTEFANEQALSLFDQPSTRSSEAVRIACQLLGIPITEIFSGGSSRAKGEDIASELFSLISCGYSILFERSSSIEMSARARGAIPNIRAPLQISMGGSVSHPTQTFSEIITLMELFRCNSMSLEELREITKSDPPTVMFYGRFNMKRADQALADFIIKRLKWQCVVVAPYESDLPTNKDIFKECHVVGDSPQKGKLNSIIETHKPKVLYMSNAEATANVDKHGSGQGKLRPATGLSLEELRESRTVLFHPLPASGELDWSIYGDPLFLGERQISNKIYFMAAMLTTMLLRDRLVDAPSKKMDSGALNNPTHKNRKHQP